MHTMSDEKKSQNVRERPLLAIKPPWTMILFLLLLFHSKPFLVPVMASEKKNQGLLHCDIHHSPCTQYLSDVEVTFDVNPKPVAAMKGLTFRVTLSRNQPSSPPIIDLEMPGMKMGPNQVTLKAVGDGTYEGTGIIVRCPSGRRDWRATVIIPDLGSVAFTFDVVY